MPTAISDLLKLLGIGGAPVILAVATYFFFHFLDRKASPQAKRAISNWMRPVPYKKQHVATAVVETFDRVYSKPLLRPRAFFRSALISLTLWMIAVIFFPGIFWVLWAMYGTPGLNFDAIFWRVVCFTAMLNVTADYLSLFLVRRCLLYAGERPLLALLVAPVAGALIVATFCWVQVEALQGGYLSSRFAVKAGWGAISATFTNLYAAFAVHVWLVLFAFGVVVVKALNSFVWAASQMKWFLKRGKDHPFDAIGFVAAPTIFIVTLIARLVAGAVQPN